MQLSDAIVRWWVLDDDHHGRRREASLWASTGHAAAVFGDELYDVLAQTRGGYGRLQDVGIRFGYERVVLHLQPRVEAGRLESNTARTQLVLDHEPAAMDALGGGVRGSYTRGDHATPGTRGQRRRRPSPGGDPQPGDILATA